MFKKIFLFLLVLISFSSISYSYINISSCQTISSSGEYRLNQSLSVSSSCMVINSSNVEFNCQSYNITGLDSNNILGIEVLSNSNNTSIKNCNINNYGNSCISFISSKNISVLNSNFSNCGYDRNEPTLKLENIENSYFSNLFFNNRNVGIGSISGTYIRNNIFLNITMITTYSSDVDSGFFFDSSSNNNIYRNIFLNMTEASGMEIGDNEILENIIITNEAGYTGIEIMGDHNILRNISIIDASEGIKFSSSSFNNLSEIFIVNSDEGLYFNGNSDNNIIFNSSIISNTYNLYFRNYTTNTPENNIFFNNYLGISNKIYSNFNFINNNNFFNYSYNGDNIGNYWDDINCVTSILIGNYFVCTNPSEYEISSIYNILDYAPLAYLTGYITPNPSDGAHIWKSTGSSILFIINISGLNYATLTLNGVDYTMDQSYGLCQPSLDTWCYYFTDLPDSITEYDFQISTNFGPLEPRTFTFYPAGSKGHVAPGFGLYSIFIMLFIIFGSLFFTNNIKKNKKAITTTVSITLVLLLTVSVYVTLTIWNQNLLESIKTKETRELDAFNDVKFLGFKTINSEDYLFVKNDRNVFFLIEELYINDDLCPLDDSNVIAKSQITPIKLDLFRGIGGCTVNTNSENEIIIYTNFGIFEGKSGFK